MQYRNGKQIELGDRILHSGDTGTVVCVIGGGLYTETYTEASWSYLETGFLAIIETMGLVHFSQMVDDVVLVARLKMDETAYPAAIWMTESWWS